MYKKSNDSDFSTTDVAGPKKKSDSQLQSENDSFFSNFLKDEGSDLSDTS